MEQKKRKIKFETSGLPKGMQKKAYIFCAIMVIPAIYGIIRFFITNFYSIMLAFSWGTPFEDQWAGLGNFESVYNLMKGNGELLIALKNTLKYFCVGIIKLFLTYVIAYFLYKKIPGNKVYRLLFFLPCLVAPVIAVEIWRNMMRWGGPVWHLLNNWGWAWQSNLFMEPATATKMIITYSMLSGFGTTYLIFMGTMNRIPGEVIESAQLDGCKAWREFWSIIMPLTWGTFSTFLLMQVAMIFTSSGPILYFIGEGERAMSANAQTIGYWMFVAVRSDSLNVPAAIGLVLTVAGIPIMLLTRLIIKKLDAEVTY